MSAQALTAPVRDLASTVAADPDLIAGWHGLARFLGVSIPTVKRRRHQLPPGFRVGRTQYWQRSALLAHIGGASK